MSLPPSPNHSPARTEWQLLRSPYSYLDGLSKELGETFMLRRWGHNIVIFSNPEHVKEIFADGGEELEAGRFNEVLAPLLGDRSVLMVDGHEHRRKRNLLLPPLRGDRLRAYGQTMLDISDDAIDAFAHGKPFSFHKPMQDITLRVIIQTILGFEGTRQEAMIRSTKRLLKLAIWPLLLAPFMQFDLGRFSHYGRYRRALADIDALLYEAISRRQKDGTRGPDILSLLLEARDADGDAMSRDELRDELLTLLVAGHETTATALTWAMHWLLESPELLGDLRAAIDALGPDPTPEAIARCELLDATVREALRLVPVVPQVGRVLSKDRRVGEWDLKKGDIVVCSIYLAHRRRETFPDPEKFDPIRFLGKKMSASEFFPFGGGVRRCIGMAFALHEMKMVLARVVTRTELVRAGKRSSDVIRRAITIAPADGLRVVLRNRRTRPTKQTAPRAAA
ncbi:MAG TPA: cytochrome P450 [Labilithrix sp.]|jgi:cytochrome P450|nr:cytochrome P450 [Labilithrix sp.]